MPAPSPKQSPQDPRTIYRTNATLPKPKTTLPKPANHSQIIRKSFADHSAALTLPGRIDTQIIPCQSQIIRRSLGHKKTPPVGGVKPKGGAEGEIRSLTRVNNKQLQTINKYRQEGDNLP